MAKCEPLVSCINIKKISKIKNISQFGLEQNFRERECVKPGKIRNFQQWKNDNNNNKLLEWFKEA